MRIILDVVKAGKNGDVSVTPITKDKHLFEYSGHVISNNSSVVISSGTKRDEVDQRLKKYFKGVRDTYSQMEFEQERASGIYKYGDATGELIKFSSGEYRLNIKAKTWEGFGNIEALVQMIRSGELAPCVVYNKKQQEIHLLDVLEGLITTRPSLSWVQRFILSMRLLGRKGA